MFFLCQMKGNQRKGRAHYAPAFNAQLTSFFGLCSLPTDETHRQMVSDACLCDASLNLSRLV